MPQVAHIIRKLAVLISVRNEMSFDAIITPFVSFDLFVLCHHWQRCSSFGRVLNSPTFMTIKILNYYRNKICEIRKELI